jgi:hypothetical protein
MSKIAPTVMWGCLTVLGAALLYWSGRLSLHYNSWTTSFRERHPHFDAPPRSQLNTKIVMWLFRLVGGFLVLLSILALIGFQD